MMKAVQIKEFGPPENMYIGNVDKPVVSSSHHMLIRVVSSAMCRTDTIQRKGLYPSVKGESNILGLEVSGIVYEVGKDVTKFK